MVQQELEPTHVPGAKRLADLVNRIILFLLLRLVLFDLSSITHTYLQKFY